MGDRIRVLHVDDDLDFAEMVATFLEREDPRFVVGTATGADEAIDRLDEYVDCVVSDYDMPGRNGIELLDAVREDRPDLPFILFTGKGSEAVASDAISSGVTDYLQKGTGTEQYELLANRIANAVDAYRSHRVLTERTRRLETLISNLPGMVYRCRNDRSWQMETVEGEAEALTGYSAETLTGTEVLWGESVVHPDDRDAVWEAVQEGLSTDGTFELTYRIRTRDGRTRWVWERGRAVHDDGDVAALEGFVTDVTERKEREERLERATARLEALFENSPDMIDVHTADGTVVDVNRRFCEVFDQPREELVGKKVWEIDRELDPDEMREIWAEMDVGDRREVETAFRRSDGERFPVKIHLTRLPVDDGEQFMVISRDISARVERERELRRYERVVNTMQEAACIYDRDGRFMLVNEYLADFYGTSPEALVGERSALLPKIRDAADGDPVRELFEGDRDELRGEVASEFPGVGREVLAYRLTPFVVDGAVEGVVAVAHEVTDREERVREIEARTEELEALNDRLEEQYRYLFEEAPVMGLLTRAEADGPVVEDCNRRFAERLGYERADVVGLPLAEFYTADSRHRLLDENGYQRALSGEFVSEDRKLVTADGEIVETLMRAIPRQDARRDVDGTFAFYIDISERKELKREKERLDEFTSIVSHDLRNPLNVARGNVELAREAYGDEYLDTVASAHERMETLIEDLLALARSGKHIDDVGPVALDELIDTCWLNIDTGDATLVTDVDGVIRADRSRVQQLLENLVRNSVEHGSTGSRPEADDGVEHGSTGNRRSNRAGDSVEHSSTDDRGAERAGESVTITVGELPDGFYVEDDGPGIPEDRRGAIFDAGFSTTEDGTGFGLSIVQQIVEAHGWTVGVVDGDDGGARFEITGVTKID